MPKQFTLTADSYVRGDQLVDEINDSPDNSIVEMINDQMRLVGPRDLIVDDGVVPDGEEPAVQAVIDLHIPDPLYTDFDKDRARARTAKESVNVLFAGLRLLDPEDAAYAAYGRAFAMKNGASKPEIDGIVDRVSAATYLTGTTFWSSMTPAERQRWTLDKDAEMLLLQVIASLI